MAKGWKEREREMKEGRREESRWKREGGRKGEGEEESRWRREGGRKGEGEGEERRNGVHHINCRMLRGGA